MRPRDMALAALALRASPTRPSVRERRLVPAVDEPDAARLNRDKLSLEQAALIASLWSRPGICILPVDYRTLEAPALFAIMFAVSWRRASEPERAFARAEGKTKARRARAA